MLRRRACAATEAVDCFRRGAFFEIAHDEALHSFDAELVWCAPGPCCCKAERMTAAPPDGAMARENIYLRSRVMQLQDDVTAITAEAERLRQIVERLHGRAALRQPNPLSGGQ